jgi:hypothetical protein
MIARKSKGKPEKPTTPKTVTYGSAPFLLPPGAAKLLSVPLLGPGKALFSKKHHTAVVWANVQLTGGRATSTRITLHG